MGVVELLCRHRSKSCGSSELYFQSTCWSVHTSEMLFLAPQKKLEVG